MHNVKILDIDGITLLYEFVDTNNEFCLSTFFKTGAFTEDDTNSGITHFLEHMFAKQTKTRSEKDILNFLKLYLPKYNAFTSFDKMVLLYNTSVRHIDKVFEFAGDVLINSVFTDQRAEKECNVIEQEISMYEVDNGARASEELLKTIYKYPFAQNGILGTRQSVLSTRGAQLTARYNELACKENVILSFAGNASEEQVVELVKKHFSSLPSKPSSKFKTPDIQLNGEQKVVIHKKPKDKACTVIMCTKFNFDSKDMMQVLYGNLLSQYLNGQGHPMWNKLREEKSLVYTFQVYKSYMGDSTTLNFAFETNKENISECISTYSDVLKNLYDKGISQLYFDELIEAQKTVIDGMFRKPISATTNAKAYYKGEDFFDRDAVLEALDKATLKDFMEFYKTRIYSDFVALSAVGNVNKSDIQSIKELQALFTKKQK